MAALFHAGRDGAACRIEALCLFKPVGAFLFFSFFKRKRFDKIQVAELVNQGKGNEYKTAPKEAGSVLPARWKMHVESPWKYFK